MDFRKNLGIILMMLGVLLTTNQSGSNNEFNVNLRELLEVYWPLMISFIGIYMISVPRKRRK